MSGTHSPVLVVDGIFGGYGEVEILRDVSIRVEAGEIVTITGPNGAGPLNKIGVRPPNRPLPNIEKRKGQR